MASYSDSLEELFDKFLEGPRIFKDREVLRPDYIPNHLPHREAQILRIGGILAPVLQGFRGSNILLYGKTGTGKTAVVKYILDRLLNKSREVNESLFTCYVNCRLSGTTYRILADLSGALGMDIPFTGLATTEVYKRFMLTLDSRGLLMIVVLDEVDTLVKSHGDSILYELTRINEFLRHGRLSIIGISNDIGFKEFLDPRILSSLSEEEVIFDPYMAPEIRDILLERAKISFLEDGILTSGALNLCSAIAASEHGDARRALDLLRVGGELAEREGSTKIFEDHIQRAQEKIEHDRITMILKTLPPHSRLVLCGVYLLRNANINSTTRDIYEIYRDLCGQVGFEPLTQRRVSSLISELDVMGIINTRLISLGRYGRTKKIRMGLSNSTIKEAYAEDTWIKPLLKYTPKYLAGLIKGKR